MSTRDQILQLKQRMGESIIGTPAIADGRLFLRTRTKLFCVEEPGK